MMLSPLVTYHFRCSAFHLSRTMWLGGVECPAYVTKVLKLTHTHTLTRTLTRTPSFSRNGTTCSISSSKGPPPPQRTPGSSTYARSQQRQRRRLNPLPPLETQNSSLH